MILSAQSIERRCSEIATWRPLIAPFNYPRKYQGMTYGLGACGYDICVAEEHHILPGKMALGSSVERFIMPHDLCGIVHDKSSWARKGIAVQNTVLEPGWEGFLTLELSNHSDVEIAIQAHSPIAQVIFHVLDEVTVIPYKGKYQNQKAGPQTAIYED